MISWESFTRRDRNNGWGCSASSEDWWSTMIVETKVRWWKLLIKLNEVPNARLRPLEVPNSHKNCLLTVAVRAFLNVSNIKVVVNQKGNQFLPVKITFPLEIICSTLATEYLKNKLNALSTLLAVMKTTLNLRLKGLRLEKTFTIGTLMSFSIKYVLFCLGSKDDLYQVYAV